MSDEGDSTALVRFESARQYYYAPGLDSAEGSEGVTLAIDSDERMVVEDPLEANLIGSLCKNGRHLPVIDVDLPCRLVPSTTPGHFHLYIEREMEHEPYMAMLKALAEAGIVNRFYAEVARLRGQTFVRPPWVKKPPKPADTPVTVARATEMLLGEQENWTLCPVCRTRVTESAWAEHMRGHA